MALYAFDGTWNTDSDEDLNDSNVVRFGELYEGKVEYLEGVGTRVGAVGKVLGGLFGLGGRSRIEEMTEALVVNWESGDNIIDVIGFSRGAALAVHFTNQIGRQGLTLSSGEIVNPRIRFLGLWDIVASFGLSFDTLIDFNRINLGWDIDTVADNVEHCFHAMALDERRETFRITRLNESGARDNIQETWFRGVHADIGGGNRNTDRSNIALNWMMGKADSAGVQLNWEKSSLDKYKRKNRFAKISDNQDLKADPRRQVRATDDIDPSALPIKLAPGQSHTTEVYSKLRFNWSAVELEKSGKYQITVDENEQWHDKDITCTALGWRSEELSWYKEAFVETFEKHRRCVDANWFELIGAYGDSDDELIRIGQNTTFEATQTTDLYLFANDLKNKYGNNSGSVTVRIQRLS